MLKKLRIKFITIAMIAIFLSLTAIIVTINAVNYAAVVNSADEVVNFLIQNDGKFPVGPQDNVGPNARDDGPPERRPENYVLPDKMSKETPFNTRFFSVTYDKNGTVIEADLNSIASVSEDEAKEMSAKILSKNRVSGTYSIYRYHVKTFSSGEKMVLFVDISNQLEPIKGFIEISLIVMAVCMVLSFVGLFLISKPLLKPIAESYARQKRFITDAGHELKTPLTIISANNEIQEMETGETESTKVIAKQVSRMTNMVKNLTELAKMDEDEKLFSSTFFISDAFEEVCASFENVFKRKNITFTFSTPGGVTYHGNEALIRRLFSLLIENASKYSLTQAKAELTKKNKKICLTVENDAAGIQEGSQEKCFERFYRSEEARAGDTEGSGIGLSTAKEIVRAHKGKITAEGTKDGHFRINVIL